MRRVWIGRILRLGCDHDQGTTAMKLGVLSQLLVLIACNSIANGDPRMPSFKGSATLSVEKHDFGTTSVGVRIGELVLYYEHSGHKPRPAPGWYLIAPADGRTICRGATFSFGDQIVHADKAEGLTCITKAQLKAIVQSERAVVVMKTDDKTETISIAGPAMVSLRELATHGSEWKPTPNVGDELSGAATIVDASSLGLTGARDCIASLSGAPGNGAEGLFGLALVIERVTIIADHERSNDEAVAGAKSRMAEVLRKASIPNRGTDLAAVLPRRYRTINLHVGASFVVDDWEAFASRIKAAGARFNVTVHGDVPNEDPRIATLKRLCNATGGTYSARQTPTTQPIR
jgi:hypothetical protein